MVIFPAASDPRANTYSVSDFTGNLKDVRAEVEPS